MKKIVIILVLVITSYKSPAQYKEIMQLALNIEKLAQFKQILTDLKKAYEILNGGYNTIKNISKGNFSLHKTFLDGLLEVSPAVKKYRRVADIVDLQLLLVREYKSAYNRFKAEASFTPQEIEYMGKVYKNLFEANLKNLDDLFMVVTAKKLRMSDDERLNAIDKIFTEMQDKVVFLRHFNSSTSLLNIQRSKEQQDVDVLRKLYDVPKP
ncbi:TerB family tellurite resistance protein [Agriterribacter sp.]|uniref:TerB family tellurite resistance protein n=1 Tax=Agriterribacter sp. TaxID=2821509 RepID=UPI002C6F319F|nr:TerB family tellurite resistance protein [Agriterribacter sp.]HTN05138.1 hypothetical protein [Agriterribacter sp.]